MPDARRVLSLRTERLTDLSPAELRDVSAAQADYPITLKCVSEMFLSLCGCLTSYCSVRAC